MAPKAKKNINRTNGVDSQNTKRKSLPTEAKDSSERQRKKIKANETVKVSAKNIKKCNITTRKIPNSVLYNFHNGNFGSFNFSLNENLKKTVIMNQVKRFQVYQTLTPFERRVTSIEWHPTNSDLFVAGSKGGELILHNMCETDDFFCPGIGAGGSVVGLKFDLHDPCTVYTASITGDIRQEDFHGKKSKTLLSTLSWENWFSSLDICYKRNMLLTGDCTGHAYLLKTTGEMLWGRFKPKLHASKITHVEINKHDENIFVTASTDKTVRLWDLRMIAESSIEETKSKLQPLKEFKYERGLSSAYFSPSNGLSLLTSDKHSELRVYSSPFWDEMLTIKHPHRCFQHITPIKANWHPLEDIIMVGRYPDDTVMQNDKRTIDFYDATNGKLLHQIISPSGKLISLNAMNITGNTLASAAGYSVVFLKDENILKGVSCHHKSNADENGDEDDFHENPKPFPKPKGRPKPSMSKGKAIGQQKMQKKVL